METFEAITTRRSIRKFIDKDVEDDVIAKCLEAARWAPSGGNSQPWHFIVVRDRNKIEQFDPYHHQPWVTAAPVVVVCCMDPARKWKKYDESMENYFIGFLDMGAAIQNFLLTAHDCGLGAVWVAAFSPQKVREMCRIPDRQLIISLLCMGYFREDEETSFRESVIKNSDRRNRRLLKDLSSYELFGSPFVMPEPT